MELNEQGLLTGSMSFKKWPIDDDRDRLSIKSNLTKVQLQDEELLCKEKKLILVE